jgi:hypothetical protein
LAGQLGGCLAEIGPLYDSFNKNVIPRAQIAAPHFVVRCLMRRTQIHFAAPRGLAAVAFQRDHEGSMTWFE